MRIVDVNVRVFNYTSTIVRDDEGHTHPGEDHDARGQLLTVVCDDGSEGYSFGPVGPGVVTSFIKPLVVGEDPYFREKIWQHLVHNQRGSGGALNDRVLATFELALWDLAGRKLGLPVSTTHVSVGSIAGIGAGAGTVDWATMRNIALSWIATLPLATVLAWLTTLAIGAS